MVLTGKIDKLDIKETMRYLGYAGVKSADGLDGLIAECEGLIQPVLAPKAVYDVFPLTHGEGEALDLGFARVNSHPIFLNLNGCKKIALFAATVGAGVDRLILKYNRLSPARAVVLQAMGAAAAEHQPCSAHILSPCLCFLSVSPGRYATPRYSSSVSPGSAMISSATSLPT